MMTSTEKPAACRAAEGFATPKQLRQAYRTIINFRNTVGLKNKDPLLSRWSLSVAPCDGTAGVSPE